MNFKKFISVAAALAVTSSFAISASALQYDAVGTVQTFHTSGSAPIGQRVSFGTTFSKANTVMVTEFDIKVDDGVLATFGLYNGSNLGHTIRFDARNNGETVIGYTPSGSSITEINKNSAWSKYKTGATAHVVIQAPITASGTGSASMTVTPATSADRQYFLWEKDGGYTQRNPYSDREIAARNLSTRKANSAQFDVDATSATEAGATAVISNAVTYYKGVNATKLDVFTSDEGADEDTVTAFTAEMNLTGNLNVYVDDVQGTVSAAEDGYTTNIDGSVLLGIIAEGEHDAAVVYVY